MTKRQRAQVVELLRCAADYTSKATVVGWDTLGLGQAQSCLDAPEWVWDVAFDIRQDIVEELCGPDTSDTYRTTCLEAAARLEEGSWP